MKSKPKTCPTCGKKITYPGLSWPNHLAMHEREESKALIYGWSHTSPFKAARPLTPKLRHNLLK